MADTGKDLSVNSHDSGQAEVIPGTDPAEAVCDGALDGGASAVRGEPEWRRLSFRTSGLTIELEITGTGEARRIVGQLIPRQSAAVDIRHEGGVITVQADSLGRFSAESVPFGQVRLRCHLGIDQSPIVTGWIAL
jgi:hypothetical protein